ncbi:Histamine H1 receptor [Toxocara canis]|uniref:Histamine H1 receptor n=1 Tax=Toxocara canis TaxID=6265 RepID=A0A0B2W4E9_TOXCA|nr:Histamine H1 receptor [Toxocara canis]
MRLLLPEVRHVSILNTTSDRIDYQGILYVDFTTVVRYGAVSLAGFTTTFTILANMLTIFVLIRHRQLHSSVSNLYILSLSFADLFIGLLVMVIMAVHLFVYRLRWFFGPSWLCDAWQLSDIIFSTTSLYSICAIALDRVWNLEKPLRVFKRNRKMAKRLIIVIWILPIVTWTPIYFVLTNRIHAETFYALSKDSIGVLQMQTTTCYTHWNNQYVVPVVAVPLLYIPAIVLIAMFIRISLVVHRHLKFLREHSNKSMKSIASLGIDVAPPSSSNSVGKSREGTPLRTPELSRKSIDNNFTTLTSGCSGSAARSSRSPSPRLPKLEWNLAPLSEEHSSGRDRSQSEHFQLPNEQLQQLKETAVISKHHRNQETVSVPVRRQSIQSKDLLMIQRSDVLLMNTSNPEGTLLRISSARSLGSAETPSGYNGAQRRLSRLSTLSRAGSCRFSVIAISTNLVELLHREGVSRQVRAAKAVALILSSFLVCWVPFLVLWPIKVFCNECISEDVYMTSIWLNYLCSTINPILYTLSSPRIRGLLRIYLTCRSPRSPLKASAFRSATIV